jgi:hypothetical protein
MADVWYRLRCYRPISKNNSNTIPPPLRLPPGNAPKAIRLPDGIVVQGLPMDHIHPEFDPGVDHECFAGAGGPSFVRGIRMVYGVGDKIEIMVNLTGESRVVPVDPTHTTQVQVCDELSDNLAFRVGVNWGP